MFYLMSIKMPGSKIHYHGSYKLIVKTYNERNLNLKFQSLENSSQHFDTSILFLYFLFYISQIKESMGIGSNKKTPYCYDVLFA